MDSPQSPEVMDNPSRILLTLDEHLERPTRMILYGRAALYLGFDAAPLEIAESKDVDAIIPLADLDGFDEQFWKAQETTNELLRPRGLYITHLFRADQVFLRAQWEQHIVPLERPTTKRLRLFRPATLDLILTKMMRGDDAQDLADIEFMVHHDKINLSQIDAAFADVVLPDLSDLHDMFQRAQPEVRRIARNAHH